MIRPETVNIGRYYVKGGHKGRWDEKERRINPKYGFELYGLLEKKGMIPNDLNGFVFLGISANKATKEAQFAQLLDRKCEKIDLIKPPQVIVSDSFGTDKDSGRFVPGFDQSLTPKLEKVIFSYISADGTSIPIADGSVDIIFDRLGVLWYKSLLSPESDWDENKENYHSAGKREVLTLLKHIISKLKSNGKYITDAVEYRHDDVDSKNTNASTRQMLAKFFPILSDLEVELGVKISIMGEDDNVILVFEKIDKTNKSL